MRNLFVPASAALLALSCFLQTPAAKAETFDLTASGASITLTATLTGVADPYVAGAFDITGGSGYANGTAITIYTPSGTSAAYQDVTFNTPGAPEYEYDNVIYTEGNSATGLDLDAYGLLFSEADNHINLFGQGAYSFTNDQTIYGYSGDGVPNLSITPVTGVTPEPSSLALLGTGMLAALGVVRRRLNA